MKGTCVKCGCTEQKPCFEPGWSTPCGWIDAQEDLCSACAAILLQSPIELPGDPGRLGQPAWGTDVANALLLIRAPRSALARAMANQERLLEMLGDMPVEAPSALWTPEGF